MSYERKAKMISETRNASDRMSAGKKPLRAAIIGYGKMGRIRAKCIEDCPILELVAIAEIAPIDNSCSVPVCKDFQSTIEYRPEVVFICLPNCFLADAVCYFLDRNVHAFCEKPPGRNSYDIERMIRSERTNPGLKLKFGFNHRYHQSILDAKSIADKGRLGKVLWMRGIYGKAGANHYEQNWRNDPEMSGGGILIDQGIHMVDLFRLFCNDFNEIKSFINSLYWPVTVEDNAFVLLRNEQKQIAMLHSSATQWKHKFQLDIYLEKGYLTIQGILSSTRTYGKESLRIAHCIYDHEGYPLPNPEETINYYEDDLSWKLEVDEFVECILEDKPIKIGTSSDAYQTMLLIEKIYESDQAWDPIRGKN